MASRRRRRRGLQELYVKGVAAGAAINPPLPGRNGIADELERDSPSRPPATAPAPGRATGRQGCTAAAFPGRARAAAGRDLEAASAIRPHAVEHLRLGLLQVVDDDDGAQVGELGAQKLVDRRQSGDGSPARSARACAGRSVRGMRPGPEEARERVPLVER